MVRRLIKNKLKKKKEKKNPPRCWYRDPVLYGQKVNKQLLEKNTSVLVQGSSTILSEG